MQIGLPHGDIKLCLTSFELDLCEYFKRVEIQGKRGRKVPVILTRQLEAAIGVIIKLRAAVGVNVNNQYVFAIPMMQSLQYLRGSDAIRKHVQLSNLQCPESVTSTKLRKHIATLCQILNLQTRELEMLAGSGGHRTAIYEEYYRLPKDISEIAKCGKILMMMDKGKIGGFIGKTLDKIDIDLDGKDLPYMQHGII